MSGKTKLYCAACGSDDIEHRAVEDVYAEITDKIESVRQQLTKRLPELTLVQVRWLDKQLSELVAERNGVDQL
jgi:hypothetical protein